MKISSKNVQMFSKSRLQALDKLASGKRVDSAKDDTGALNVSTNLAAKEASLKVAVRNIGDAISMATMADAGLQHIEESLNKLRELSTQAANGLLNDADRTLLQKEFTAHMKQIESVSRTTEYNGISLLNKPADGSASWSSVAAHELDALPAGAFTTNSSSGTQGVASVGGRDGWLQTADSNQLWIDMPSFTKTCVKVSVDMYLPSSSSATGTLSIFGNHFGYNGNTQFQFCEFGNRPYPRRAGGQQGQQYAADLGPIVEDGWVTMSIEANRNTGEVKARINGDVIAEGTAFSTHLTGDKISLSSTGSGATNIAFSNVVIEEADSLTDEFKVQAGEGTEDSLDTVITADVTLVGLQLTSANVTNQTSAQSALAQIDNAINRLADNRATVGSGMQRLLSQYDQTLKEHVNTSSAVSKIVDQDLASASAEVSNRNIRFEISQQAHKLHKDILRERMKGLFIPI